MSYRVYARHGGAVAASLDDITARVPGFDEAQPIIELGMSFQNGGASQGTLVVPDPVGNMDDSLYFPPRTLIRWTEDASGDELWLAQGRVSAYSIGRPDYRPPAASVEWNLTVDDANVDLRGLAFTEDWVRPAETGTARLYALALYTLNGTSSTRPDFGGSITYRPSTTIIALDSHLAPDTNTVVMPAKTYPIDTQPSEVLTDIASTEGKVFGVVLHHTGGSSHLCILYILETDHSTYASPCKISDNPADWDPEDLSAPVFVPIYDQGDAQRVDGNAFISGIVSRYGAGADQIEVLLDTTAADATEYWVESYQDGDSTEALQAQARATAIIAYRSPYAETDSVSIDVLPEQAHLITAGMSLQIKAAPINTSNDSSIGSYLDRRIVSLQWQPRADGLYHGVLQLNKPTRGSGAGIGRMQPASTTPKGSTIATSCPCIETFNRTVASDNLGVSDLNNDLWVIDDASGTVSADGASAVMEPPIIAHVPITTAMPHSRFEMRFKARLTAPYAGDNGFLLVGFNHGALGGTVQSAKITIPIITAAGNWTFYGNISFRQEGQTGTANSGDILLLTYAKTTDDGPWFWVHLLVAGNTAKASLWRDGTSEPPDWGMTYDQFPVQDYNLSSELNDRLVVFASAGNDVANVDSVWEIDQIQIVAGMWCCSPPTAGEIASAGLGYGNGSQTVFHVPAMGYAPGSLRVGLDGLDQTDGVSESDPATGEFTFSFTPLESEIIDVIFRLTG